MKKTLSAMAVALLVPTALAGCGSDSSKKAATSPSPHSSTFTPSSTSSSPTSDALASKVTLLQKAGKAWSSPDKYVAAAGSIVATTEATAVPTTLTGRDASTGRSKWTADLSAPNGMEASNVQFQQLGSSVAVQWDGTGGGSDLQSGSSMTAVAIYDLGTGKRLGPVRTSNTPTGMDTPNAASGHPFTLVWNDQDIRSDGSAFTEPDSATGDFSDPSNWMGDQSFGSSARALTVTPTAAIVDLHSGGDTDKLQVWNPTTHKAMGSPVSCSAADDGTAVTASPNGRYVIWGQSAMDLKTGAGWCVKNPASDAAIKVISDNGTVYGTGNGHLYSQSWHTDAATVQPDGATTPTVVLAGAAVYAVKSDDDSQDAGVVGAPMTK